MFTSTLSVMEENLKECQKSDPSIYSQTVSPPLFFSPYPKIKFLLYSLCFQSVVEQLNRKSDV